MYKLYIENKDGYVTAIPFDCLEDIVIHTSTFNDCKITIEKEWTGEDTPESIIDNNQWDPNVQGVPLDEYRKPDGINRHVREFEPF